MEINWTMVLSLTVVAILGGALLWGSIEAYRGGVSIEVKCAVPWSDQTHRDDICTRTIYCNGINRVFYLKECRKLDALKQKSEVKE